MLVLHYPSKKVLKENIGKYLNYSETSLFGNQYISTGTLVGCNRPHLTGFKREFFAEVTLKDNIITGVK